VVKEWREPRKKNWADYYRLSRDEMAEGTGIRIK